MNSYCDICQAGKLRQKPLHRRRKDVFTGDLSFSVDDDKYGLVMLDVGSDGCDVLSSNNNATSVLAAIKEFGGAVT